MKTVNRSEVNYINHMGDDLTVVNAARVSFGKRKEAFDEADTKLIRYLAKNEHWTPFAHCMLTLHLSVPIFVSRQLVRHTVGLVINEESRRYIDDEPAFYLPDEWRGRPEKSIKQGSGAVLHSQDDVVALIAHDATTQALAAYDRLLEFGVAPEQARMVLPLNMMTQFYWSGSLAAWARVCRLRLDAHAQAETRQVAEGISAIANERFPISWAALMEAS